MWLEAIKDGEKVRIIVFQFEDPKTGNQYTILYADADGVLHHSHDISEFCMCE